MDATQRTHCHARAFTLIELLTVIVVVAILATIVSALLQRAKADAHRVGCVSNLRQIGVANLRYMQDNSNYIAAGNGTDSTAVPDNIIPARRFWWMRLMPYLGVEEIHDDTEVAVFVCPSDPMRGGDGSKYVSMPVQRRSYGLNKFLVTSPSGMVVPRTIWDIDQPQKTAYAADMPAYELNTGFIDQVAPWVNYLPTQWHRGNMNVVFVDGHVEGVPISSVRSGGDNHWIWQGR